MKRKYRICTGGDYFEFNKVDCNARLYFDHHYDECWKCGKSFHMKNMWDAVVQDYLDTSYKFFKMTDETLT